MQIKYYDDVLMVECDKFKYSKYFESLKGKWVDIKGRNHFAVGKENELELSKVVDEIKKAEDLEEKKYIKKYNNTALRQKEEYYKSFSCKPINFGNLKVDETTTAHSLSSSSHGGDDDESSDGFPSPRTPGKNHEEEDDDDEEDDDFEYIFEKLEEFEKRLARLESKLKLK